MRAALLICCLLALPAAWPERTVLEAAQPDPEEVCRIRIGNKVKGLIQVSTDEGRTYWAVGRVRIAANARIPGFAAASYAPQGTVAATAIHGLRIKTGQAATGMGKAQQPLLFSITPSEFAVIPHRYGGHQPRSAQIVTDIPAGRSIFRNQAPYVGSPVFIEKDGRLSGMPEDYAPIGGETFVIVVKRPAALPSEITIENRTGGAVRVCWPDGRMEKLTNVVRPVKGVGRYDGTTFTGPGAINTNHCGVITIGTAPLCPPGTKEGGRIETRGGFMIQPSYHAAEQGETAPQVMVVGPVRPQKPVLEGTPPLFFGCINLARYPGHPKNSCRVEVRINEGDWQPPPPIVGKADSALNSVTAVRIAFPEHSAELLARDLAKESAECARRAASPAVKRLTGIATLQPRQGFKAGSAVAFYVDGSVVGFSNRFPYTSRWDTRKVPNGLHEVTIRSMPGSGEPVADSRTVLVANQAR